MKTMGGGAIGKEWKLGARGGGGALVQSLMM